MTLPTIETGFSAYDGQLDRIAEYIETIAPSLVTNRQSVPVFVESLTVVMVARFEHFLTSLIAGGVRHRESVARAHFMRFGNPDELRVAESCDLKALIKMARRRLSFRKQGKSIETIFAVLFEFSPWPSVGTFQTVNDLVLLRNLLVHEGDTVLAEQAAQAHHKALFTTRSYGEFAVCSVNYGVALPFLQTAMIALKNQAEHVRREFVSRPEWNEASSVRTNESA